MTEGEAASERGGGAVASSSAACRRIAGSGLCRGLSFAVIAASAITHGPGRARGRPADSAILALEHVFLGIFVR